MRKLLVLFVLSIALTSCFSETEELPINYENATGVIDIIDDNSNIEENIDDDQNIDAEFTGSTDVEGTENNLDTNIDDNINATGSTKIETTDESELEAEVNDLLDEFIDSLDSYDK